MKKYLFVVFLICLTNKLFADAKKEIENFVKKDVSSKQFQQDDNVINSLQEHGIKLSRAGKYNKAMQCYQKALEQADKLYGKESTASAMIYTSMATLFLKKKEKLKAADSFVKAADIYKKSMGGMLRPGAGRLLLMQAGFLYYDSSLYKKTWQVLKEAEKDIAKFTPDEKKRYMPKFYRHLALAFFRDNKYKKAIPYFTKSLSVELQKKPINHSELAVIYLFIGEALLETEKLKESLSVLLKSEKHFNLCKSKSFYQYNLYFSLSIVSERLGNDNQNLIYAKKLNKTCQYLDLQNFRRIIGLICLADALNVNNQKDEAVKLMKQALKLAKKQKQTSKSIMRIQRHLQEIIKQK